jgi:hypothetical protein
MHGETIKKIIIKMFHKNPTLNILIINSITNRCIWNTRVTWQGIEYKLPKDDKTVSKHVGVW